MRFMEIFLKEIAGEWEVLVFSELPLPGEPVPQKAGGEFRTIYYLGNRGGLMKSSQKVGGNQSNKANFYQDMTKKMARSISIYFLFFLTDPSASSGETKKSGKKNASRSKFGTGSPFFRANAPEIPKGLNLLTGLKW